MSTKANAMRASMPDGQNEAHSAWSQNVLSVLLGCACGTSVLGLLMSERLSHTRSKEIELQTHVRLGKNQGGRRASKKGSDPGNMSDQMA